MIKEEVKKSILQQPSLASQLPFRFKNGTSMQIISTNCSQCNSEISQENIRGTLVEQNTMTVSLEGHGLCFECHCMSPISARFNNDGTVRYKEGGEWKRANFIRPAGILQIAFARVGAFFKKLHGSV